MGQRSSMASTYFVRLWESPFLGQGPDFAAQQIATRNFLNVSQNAWLEWSMKFGIPYALLVAYTLVVTYRWVVRNSETERLMRSQGTLLLVLFAVASWSLVDPLWLREVVVALGVVIGSVLAKTSIR